LKLISDKVHETEGVILDSGDSGFKSNSKEIVLQHLENLGEELDGIKNITNRFSSFGESSGIIKKSKIDQFFDTLNEMVKKIAEELGKDVVLVTMDNLEDFPYLREMKDSIIHLIRNSIDHGVEDSFERLSEGKSKSASIKLEIGKLSDGTFRVYVSDDGRGIDFKSLRKSAEKKGLIDDSEISNIQLAEILFSSNFSTRNEVSSISGRGVGLDVVSDAVKSLNGTISIATTAHKGTKFTIKLPSNENV
jgi:two-component system chemotaxis sensor kinase CheA